MKKMIFLITGITLTLLPSLVIANCDELYTWNTFTSFKHLQEKIDELSRDPRNQKVLFETENCLKTEADQLNIWWTTRHFDLVEQINQTQKTLTQVEKHKIERKQILEEIEIQKQAIQSLRLIYQSKLLEIPTAYLLIAKKRVDVGAVQKEIEREVHDACQRYLQIRFTDHHIKSETVVQNYRVILDFIEDFQGGRAQSFEFDPVVYQDENEILHYIQVYRLYPLFPIERDKNVSKLLESVVMEERELKKFITPLATLDDSILLPIIRKQHLVQLNNMLSRVRQINQESLDKLGQINRNYHKKISTEEQLLARLKRDLQNIEKKITTLPATEDLEKTLNEFQTQLNKHVNSREIIVVTNPSELSHSGTAVTDQYLLILEQAYKSLIARARESKAYKFYRVENGRLTEADAATYYSKVDPVKFVMPYFRKTHRKAEGVWRLGIVMGLRIRLSHDGKVVFFPGDSETDISNKNRNITWFILWFSLLTLVCGIITVWMLYRKPKKKLLSPPK